MPRNQGGRHEAIDGIGSVRVRKIGFRGEGCRKVATRGETEHAEAMGIDIVFRGLGANEPHGALGVLQGNGVVVALAVAVAEDESADVMRVEHQRDILAFFLCGEVRVAAAGEDNHGGPGSRAGNEVGVQGRNRGIGIGVRAIHDIRRLVPEQRYAWRLRSAWPAHHCLPPSQWNKHKSTAATSGNHKPVDMKTSSSSHEKYVEDFPRPSEGLQSTQCDQCCFILDYCRRLA